MTFLQLVERLRQEVGVSGDDITTVVGLVKERRRLKTWVQQAYVEIQEERHDWSFMRKDVTFDTVAAQQAYAVGSGLDIDIADFGTWNNDSFRVYLTSAGIGNEIMLCHYIDYSHFRDRYIYGTQRAVEGRPQYITIRPSDRALLLWPLPDAVYTVVGEYYRSPHELSADADEPIFPSPYHMAIVYKAMMKYGLFEVAQEQLEAGRAGYSQLSTRMLFDYTPIVQHGGSLI